MLTSRQYSTLKGRLTRAQNSGDAARVLHECESAFVLFDRHGYPDAWNRWDIAQEEARAQMWHRWDIAREGGN